MRAGGSWSAQLAEEIAEANAFILLVGAAGVGQWQVPEYDEALDRWVKSPADFPLIVVLLEGPSVPGLPFVRHLHFVISVDPASEKDVACLYEAASGAGMRPGELWRYTQPYRGLEAMEEKDSDYFFGRKTETVDVLSALVLVGGLALPIVLIALVAIFLVGKLVWREFEVERPFMQATMMPHALTATAEATLKPGDVFRECAVDAGTDYCPPMAVVPAGSFMMGSTVPNQPNQSAALPQHRVSIATPFAVSKYELTFDEWDTRVNYGDCGSVDDAGYGRAQRPVINVSWEGVQRYVAWLSKVTGKPYRLLSEAEYEYATRAGTQTLYPWGDHPGTNNANCKDCGSPWDGGQTAAVGSFPANAFGLHDMVGNVFEWVEDCWHDNFDGAPADGSAWVTGDCSKQVIRAGSWYYQATLVQSFFRYWVKSDIFGTSTGFRVARTLVPGQRTVK